MSHKNADLGDILQNAGVIPVITIHDINHAIPMAQALVNGGLNVLEITLRTECAFEAIDLMIKNVPNAHIGVGTVNDTDKFKKSFDMGAAFAVSPGFTPDLLKCADDMALPFLPGIATPSEAMQLAERGYKYLKLFPAETLNARSLLKSIGAPLPDIKFCPTGGVNLDILAEYIKLPNVICVGGSWLTPADAIENGQWDIIENLAKQAAEISLNR